MKGHLVMSAKRKAPVLNLIGESGAAISPSTFDVRPVTRDLSVQDHFEVASSSRGPKRTGQLPKQVYFPRIIRRFIRQTKYGNARPDRELLMGDPKFCC